MMSPEARAALSSRGNFMEFERGTQWALRAGASSGASALLTELDAERERLRCGECGEPMVRRLRPLTMLWLLGRLRVVRGYWTRGCAKGGRCPLDAELGVEGRSGTRATPGLLWAAAPLAAETSFERAATLASRLLGFGLNAKWMERVAKRLGSAMASEDGSEDAPAAPAAETMCCGIDGTGVPVRPGELSESQGKDGGKARAREAKVVVFRAGGAEAAGPPRRSAAIDSAASRDTDLEPSAFAARLRREARRAGFAAARVKVVLGDGAKWIWNVASELFPDAVEIVDVWHAREHLWEVARSVHGAGAALCEAWAGKARAALSEGRLDDVLAALRKHDGNDEARRCAGYVEANRARMRYPAFRAAGLPVGSGEVESSCGTVATPQARRHALERRRRREPNPDAALLVAGRPLRRVLRGARETAADGPCRLNRRVRTNMSYTLCARVGSKSLLSCETSRHMHMAIQSCVITALRDVPTKLFAWS